MVWNLGRNAQGLWDVLTVAMGFHFTRVDLRNIGVLKNDPLMFGIKASQLYSTVDLPFLVVASTTCSCGEKMLLSGNVFHDYKQGSKEKVGSTEESRFSQDLLINAG